MNPSYIRPLEWSLDKAGGRAPLLVLLHGYRQDRATALSQWSAYKGRVHLLSVEGPLAHESGNPRRISSAWYVYDGNRERFRAEMDLTCRSLDNVVAHVAPTLDIKETWVGGFSQGGYLALYWALCHSLGMRRVHSVGGNLNADFLPAILPNTRVILSHGSKDEFLPPLKMESLESSLKERGVEVSRHSHEAGHEFTAAMAADLGDLP
ncbi:MAG: alpha/beta hydrolase [Planctomycetota bacterium]